MLGVPNFHGVPSMHKKIRKDQNVLTEAACFSELFLVAGMKQLCSIPFALV